MGRTWIVVVVVMACSSGKTDDRSKWTIQSEAHGGKPPGVSDVTTLGWDGHYRNNRTFGDDMRGTTTSQPANLIAAITNTVAKVDLPKGGPARGGGSYYEWTALTLGETTYAMPKSPELDAAVAEAMTAGAKLCTKK